MQTPTERRRNQRQALRGYGTLLTSTIQHECHLLNLSKEGALVAVLDEHKLSLEMDISIQIELGDANNVTLDAQIIHTNQHLLGIEFCAPTPEQLRLIAPMVTN